MQDEIHRNLQKMHAPADAIDDIAQDVWLGIVEARAGIGASFKGESAEHTWVWSICHNKVADFYRKEQQRGIRNRRYLERHSCSIDNNSIAMTDMQVEQILDQLREKDAAVLRKHYLHEKEFGEIAGVTGEAYECVRSRHRRALKRARRIIE